MPFNLFGDSVPDGGFLLIRNNVDGKQMIELDEQPAMLPGNLRSISNSLTASCGNGELLVSAQVSVLTTCELDRVLTVDGVEETVTQSFTGSSSIKIASGTGC